MKTTDGLTDAAMGIDETNILVAWSEMYRTGIKTIDEQHKELVNLTNELYRACLKRDNDLPVVFKNKMSRMVEYVKVHFSEELEILARVKYPDYTEHRLQHIQLIRNILDAAKSYEEGKNFVPNQFVRTLKDWIFGHIAISDKKYSFYIEEQKRKGLLTDEQITGVS